MDGDVWRGFVDFVDGSSLEIPASGGATCVEWCSSSVVACGCDDGDVALVDEIEGLVGRLEEHDSGVTGLAFGDEGLAASSSTDCTVRLWDLSASNESQRTLQHISPVMALAFSEQTLFAGDETSVVRWDPSSKVAEPVVETHSAATALVVVDHLLYAGLESGDVLVLDLRWNDPLKTIRRAHKGPVTTLCCDCENLVVSAGNDNSLKIIEQQGSIVRSVETVHTDYITGLAVWESSAAAEKPFFATGSWDGTLIHGTLS